MRVSALRPTSCSAALLLLLNLSACGSGNAASHLATAPAFEPKDQSKCGVTKSQAEPLIVEWPDAERGKLESQVRRGLVAVHYVGCEMQVLGQCRAKGVYGYAALTRKKSNVTIRDADDLYANIPAYAAKFEATLQRAGELNVAMTVVGRYETDKSAVRADELEGDCEGATHFISAVTVGAFDFSSGSDAEVGTGATVAGFGAGGKSTSRHQTLNQDGDDLACAKSTSEDKNPPDGCGALLRLEVVPLGEARQAAVVCPAGTKLDGAQCVRTQILTQLECPQGTRLNGTTCVPNVNQACPAGMHFEDGHGCLADGGGAPGSSAARTAGFGIGGAGLALIGGGVALAVYAGSQKSVVAAGGFATGSDIDSVISKARTSQGVSIAMLSVGGAAALLGLGLVIFAPHPREGTAATTKSPSFAGARSTLRFEGGALVW